MSVSNKEKQSLQKRMRKEGNSKLQYDSRDMRKGLDYFSDEGEEALYSMA